MGGRTISVRTWVLLGIGLGLMLALYTVMPLLPQGSRGAALIGSLETIVPVGMASIGGLWAAFHLKGGRSVRLPWLLMGFAVACSELAAIAEAYYVVVLAHEPPTPSIVDVLYTIGYPLAAAALLIAIRSLGARSKPALVLSVSFLIAATIGALMWFFVLPPTLLAGGQIDTANAVNALYCMADLVLLLPLAITLAYLTSRMGFERASWPWWVVVFGISVLLVADTWFTLQAATGVNMTGGTADLGYSLGYFTLGMAALVAVDVQRALATRSGTRS